MSKPTYDCSKCPAYCCSYPEIEVSKADIARLDNPHPDLLVQLLGQPALAHRAQHEAVQRPLVPRVKRFEGPGVALPVGEHQFFVRGLHPAEFTRRARSALGRPAFSR